MSLLNSKSLKVVPHADSSEINQSLFSKKTDTLGYEVLHNPKINMELPVMIISQNGFKASRSRGCDETVLDRFKRPLLRRIRKFINMQSRLVVSKLFRNTNYTTFADGVS